MTRAGRPSLVPSLKRSFEAPNSTARLQRSAILCFNMAPSTLWCNPPHPTPVLPYLILPLKMPISPPARCYPLCHDSTFTAHIIFPCSSPSILLHLPLRSLAHFSLPLPFHLPSCHPPSSFPPLSMFSILLSPSPSLPGPGITSSSAA